MFFADKCLKYFFLILKYRLEEKYEYAKSQAFGPRESNKFHGTGKEGVEAIPKGGFRLPSENSAPGKR